MAVKINSSVVYANAFYVLEEDVLTKSQIHNFANLVDKLLPEGYYTSSLSIEEFYNEYSYMFKRSGDLFIFNTERKYLERSFRYGMPTKILEVFDEASSVYKKSNILENGHKIITNEEARKKKNSDNCLVREYDFKDKDVDIAKVIITGRYPKEGFVLNEKSKELIYIINGEGTINFENDFKIFSKGDSILIDKNTKFYWDSEYFEATITCTPPFDKNQYKLVK